MKPQNGNSRNGAFFLHTPKLGNLKTTVQSFAPVN